MATLTVPPKGGDSCCPFAHKCAPTKLGASPVSGEGLGNRSRFCLFREYPVCTSPQPSKQHALHALRPESWEVSHHRRMLLHSLVAVICNSIHPPTPTPFSKAFPNAHPPKVTGERFNPRPPLGATRPVWRRGTILEGSRLGRFLRGDWQVITSNGEVPVFAGPPLPCDPQPRDTPRRCAYSHTRQGVLSYCLGVRRRAALYLDFDTAAERQCEAKPGHCVEPLLRRL